MTVPVCANVITASSTERLMFDLVLNVSGFQKFIHTCVTELLIRKCSVFSLLSSPPPHPYLLKNHSVFLSQLLPGPTLPGKLPALLDFCAWDLILIEWLP